MSEDPREPVHHLHRYAVLALGLVKFFGLLAIQLWQPRAEVSPWYGPPYELPLHRAERGLRLAGPAGSFGDPAWAESSAVYSFSCHQIWCILSPHWKIFSIHLILLLQMSWSSGMKAGGMKRSVRS